jgi:hypothetical protein
MKVEGTCHCGYVRFVADVDPDSAVICNCADCQALSGSAFRTTVRSLPGSFELLSGAPTLYVKKTAESGAPREHAFCPRCGTPIYATSVDPGPKPHSLRLGTLRTPQPIVPKRQLWVRSRLGWLDHLGKMPGAEKQG